MTGLLGAFEPDVLVLGLRPADESVVTLRISSMEEYM